MKKILSIIGLIIVLGLIYVFVFPYKIQRVCFGDVCPQNGGLFIMYRVSYSKEECLTKGSYPVEGIGWGLVYAGCSPIDHALSR